MLRQRPSYVHLCVLSDSLSEKNSPMFPKADKKLHSFHLWRVLPPSYKLLTIAICFSWPLISSISLFGQISSLRYFFSIENCAQKLTVLWLFTGFRGGSTFPSFRCSPLPSHQEGIWWDLWRVSALQKQINIPGFLMDIFLAPREVHFEFVISSCMVPGVSDFFFAWIHFTLFSYKFSW